MDKTSFIPVTCGRAFCLLARAFVIACPLLLCTFAGCSSAPKKPEVLTDTRGLAAIQLEAGNDSLASFAFDEAKAHLAEAYRLALSIDNSSLLTRILLSQVSLQSAVKSQESEAAADSLLAKARFHAGRSDEKDLLLSLCDVYEIKASIQKKSIPADFTERLDSARKEFASDPYSQALACRTQGDALSAIGQYDEAYQAYMMASEIHKKNLYLQEIGLDWYNAASCLSLKGDKSGATGAIKQALFYDRNAENTAAIAADYYALARILSKESADDAEKERAALYAQYAADIYRTRGFEDEAARCEAFMAR